MAIKTTSAPSQSGDVITTESGRILLPSSSVRKGSPHGPLYVDTGGKPLRKYLSERTGYTAKEGYACGLHLERDKETMIIRWPAKGSGHDDILNRALATGEIKNAGISPVVLPQMMTLLHRQQTQATTAALTVTGRRTTVQRVRKAISCADDSPLGFTRFVQDVVFSLRTHNRGCPIATVPITYETDQWESMGLNLRKIEGGDADRPRFYLDVDWSKVKYPIPFLPDTLHLTPTGNNLWPYWYWRKVDGNLSPILLHNSQIISVLPNPAKGAVYGTSTIYNLWPLVAENVLVQDREVERMSNAISDGIVVIGNMRGGADASEIKSMISDSSREYRDQGNTLRKGWNVLVSEDGASVASFPFRQDDGWMPDERQRKHEDIIAAAFGEALNSLVQRGGQSVHQSETASENAADSGVNGLLSTIAVVLGTIYPRVQFSVTRPNDRVLTKTLDNLKTFSEAVSKLPIGTLTADEVRAFIDRELFDIPQTGKDIDSSRATNDEDESNSTVEDAQPTVESESAITASIRRFANRVLEEWAFLPIEDAGATDEFDELFTVTARGYQDQYLSADSGAIVAHARENEITRAEELAEFTAENTEEIINHVDLGLLVALLMAFARYGQEQVEQNAEDSDVAPLTELQFEQLGNEYSVYLSERVAELFVAATGGTLESEGRQDIENPGAEKTVNDHSYVDVARLHLEAMDMAESDSDIRPIYEALIVPAVAVRAGRLANVESARAHGYGNRRTAIIMSATHMEWLKTVSARPRPEHLASVGEMVRIGESFSHGDLPGEKVGCKCGTRYHWIADGDELSEERTEEIMYQAGFSVGLTRREIDVAKLFVEGKATANEVAGELTIAPQTAKMHIRNMYGKLEVDTAVRAVLRLQELGFSTNSSG